MKKEKKKLTRGEHFSIAFNDHVKEHIRLMVEQNIRDLERQMYGAAAFHNKKVKRAKRAKYKKFVKALQDL